MTDPNDELEAELGRLAGATERLRPTAGFRARVLAAVVATEAPRDWRAGVVRFGGAMLAVAALSAIASLFVALRTDRATDDSVALTYGMEMEEAGW